MPRMPLQPCDHCCPSTSNVTSASENIKLKIMEDKLRNDFADKEHIHEQYLTEEQVLEKHYTKEETDSAIQKAAIEGKVDLTGYATEDFVNTAIANIEHPANPTKVSELENDANYTNEDKVLELIENNTNTKIGIDFTPNITVGYLNSNTPITADMTIGQIIYKMLYCEHEWVGDSCIEPRICDFCGTKQDFVEGHAEAVMEGQEPTCSMPGQTDEIFCPKCGEVLKPSEYIEQLPHNYDFDNPVIESEPDCMNSGIANYYCTECGDVYSEDYAQPLGHKYVKDETESIEATCESAGLLVEICERCGWREETTIEALGHDYTSEVTLEPTCKEAGIMTYQCSRCEDNYEEEIPQLSHEPGVPYVELEPTCGLEGEEVIRCEQCDEVLERNSVPALEHDWLPWSVVIEQTCEEVGYSERRCDNCGVAEPIELPALGHDYGDWVITNQPEVGVPGKQQKTCSRCGDIITEEIPALEPEEPTTINYYLGAIGNDSKQDDPDLWGELEEAGYTSMNPATRAEFYFNEMQNNDARSIEPASLVGQHELSWKLTTPTGLDEDLSEVFEEDTYLEETDQVYPAIALPSGYKVTAWSTDAENAYPVVDVIGEIEMTNDYTVYYAKNAFPFNAVKTFFITIENK